MSNSFCVVGSPIEHSLSPVLHSAAYSFLSLDCSYSKSRVELGGLSEFLKKTPVSGISVTMPLKREAFELAKSCDEDSKLTEVSNTLLRQEQGWLASNTDVFGIKMALLGVSSPNSTAILGSGATARSAVLALSQSFPNTALRIMARNPETVRELLLFATGLGMKAETSAVEASRLVDCDLVMSLVPIGSFDSIWDEVAGLPEPKDSWLFDVAYNPWPSKAASSWNFEKVIPGIEMLIWQAVRQVELFATSVDTSVSLDHQALYNVMKEAVSAK